MLTLPQQAHAYIDLGAGSYFLQLLIAGILGASFAVKLFWKNLTGLLPKPGFQEAINPLSLTERL